MTDIYDTPWKDMLDRYFKDFMAFFFPDAHADIDWRRSGESCDIELRKIVSRGEVGKRLADKLTRVRTRSGGDQVVMVHTEVQASRDSSLPHRIFTCNHRIFDYFHRPVVSLAILADDSHSWRPDRFGYGFWEARSETRFRAVKLVDYNERWPELEAGTNPFAVVVMAHLKALASRDAPEIRLKWKLRLVGGLYRSGCDPERLWDLYRFIDWVMELPEDLQIQLDGEVERLEMEMNMPYVTHVERRAERRGIEQGVKQGVEQGVKQGEASLLKRLLTRRFDPLPAWTDRRLEQASREELERWGERVLDAKLLDDVFKT
ncbi:MAG: DUF4351 domain-containing protein [bacterium]|nr:DUF4351 domain-containing protein [bacterium]